MSLPQPLPAPDQPQPLAENRRRHGRVRTQETMCTLGAVLDISASGMRVRCEDRPRLRQGELATITLATPAGLLALDVGVAWTRRVGFREGELGLVFGEMSEDAVTGIVSVLHGAKVGLVEWNEIEGGGGKRPRKAA